MNNGVPVIAGRDFGLSAGINYVPSWEPRPLLFGGISGVGRGLRTTRVSEAKARNTTMTKNMCVCSKRDVKEGARMFCMS